MNTLTVGELRKALEGVDPNAEVLVFGDHHGPARAGGFATNYVHNGGDDYFRLVYCGPEDMEDWEGEFDNEGTPCIVIWGM